MSLRWVLLVLVFAYGINALAEISQFNEIIEQNIEDQAQLEFEIRTHLAAYPVQKEKTLVGLSEPELISLEGFNIQIF